VGSPAADCGQASNENASFVVHHDNARRIEVAKFESVALSELKTRLPEKLLSLVEEYKDKLEKLNVDQGGRLTLEKGGDAKDLRKALKAAAGALNRRIRFPFRGEEGAVSFYLEKSRGPKPKAESGIGAEAPRRRRGLSFAKTASDSLGARPGASDRPKPTGKR
jgi:hypothetical protein